MQEQRYNVFNQIHKGLRGMLYDTAIRLQQTDFSRLEASTIVDQLEQVLIFFDEHAENEDQFILPHIRKHNAQLIDERPRHRPPPDTDAVRPHPGVACHDVSRPARSDWATYLLCIQ